MNTKVTVLGENVCTYTEGCLLEQGGGIFHRTIDCLTVEDLIRENERLQKELAAQHEKVRVLKAEIYDLERYNER